MAWVGCATARDSMQDNGVELNKVLTLIIKKSTISTFRFTEETKSLASFSMNISQKAHRLTKSYDQYYLFANLPEVLTFKDIYDLLLYLILDLNLCSGVKFYQFQENCKQAQYEDKYAYHEFNIFYKKHKTGFSLTQRIVLLSFYV